MRELLCVIAIIVLLAAILVPIVSRVRVNPERFPVNHSLDAMPATTEPGRFIITSWPITGGRDVATMPAETMPAPTQPTTGPADRTQP